MSTEDDPEKQVETEVPAIAEEPDKASSGGCCTKHVWLGDYDYGYLCTVLPPDS